MTAKLSIKKKRDPVQTSVHKAKLTEIVTQEETVRLNADMPKSKRQALKAKAVMEGRTINDVINNLVDEYLAR